MEVVSKVYNIMLQRYKDEEIKFARFTRESFKSFCLTSLNVNVTLP